MKHEKVLLVRFVLKVPPQILLFRSHGIANTTLFEVSFCLDSSAEAIIRGFPALKAKQTVQCDSKRGKHWTGLDLFLREVTVPLFLILVSSRLLIPCCVLAVYPGKLG